ncbi:hypothetical protein [Nocardia beijingensis]
MELLHNTDPRIRAIVHLLHDTITDAFDRTRSTTIAVTTDIGWVDPIGTSVWPWEQHGAAVLGYGAR